MSAVTRGFRGRRPAGRDAGRLPPGQYLTHDFPVLSAGPTPHSPLHEWTFSITGKVKQDTVWMGVSVDTLLKDVDIAAPYVMAFSDGGYTTNLPLEDITGGKAWVAFAY